MVDPTPLAERYWFIEGNEAQLPRVGQARPRARAGTWNLHDFGWGTEHRPLRD